MFDIVPLAKSMRSSNTFTMWRSVACPPASPALRRVICKRWIAKFKFLSFNVWIVVAFNCSFAVWNPESLNSFEFFKIKRLIRMFQFESTYIFSLALKFSPVQFFVWKKFLSENSLDFCLALLFSLNLRLLRQWRIFSWGGLLKSFNLKRFRFNGWFVKIVTNCNSHL